MIHGSNWFTIRKRANQILNSVHDWANLRITLMSHFVSNVKYSFYISSFFNKPRTDLPPVHIHIITSNVSEIEKQKFKIKVAMQQINKFAHLIWSIVLSNSSILYNASCNLIDWQSTFDKVHLKGWRSSETMFMTQ